MSCSVSAVNRRIAGLSNARGDIIIRAVELTR